MPSEAHVFLLCCVQYAILSSAGTIMCCLPSGPISQSLWEGSDTNKGLTAELGSHLCHIHAGHAQPLDWMFPTWAQ